MKIKQNKSLIAGLCVAIFFSLGASECERTSSREDNERKQESLMKRANQAVKVPSTTNFQARRTVAKWQHRMDKPSKTFYVYLLANNGQAIGYYVAQSRPISMCARLTPTDREVGVHGQGPNPLGNAPALNGVYYAGGGGCGTHYFFDAETDAYIEISPDMKYFVSDQPLSLKAEAIRVKAEPGSIGSE